jgi:hypothetical protein
VLRYGMCVKSPGSSLKKGENRLVSGVDQKIYKIQLEASRGDFIPISLIVT